MTGRGRGRPPKSTPSPTPPAQQQQGQPPVDPNAPRFAPMPQAPPMGFPSGMPSFTTDILNQLPPPKQGEMINLVNRFRSKQLALNEFLGISKNLLGERLYAILAQGMSSAVRVPGGAPADIFQRPQMPMMRPLNLPPHPFAQQIQPGQAGFSQPGQPNEDFGDVTKMDSASLQDVIQYSGIDLRAEAEMIESELHMPAYASGGPASQDLRIRPDYFFNMPRMKAIVYMAAKARGIATVNDEVFELIALALQRRLHNIVTGISEISKHRVDVGRLGFKIKVENDPKKQIWLLEKVYEEQLEKQQEALLQGQTVKPGDADKNKAKKPSGSEKKSTGEDVIVKTRLANTTALAALGLQQKSWMSAGIVGLQQQQSASKPGEPEDSSKDSAAVDSVKIPLHFSQAPSVTPSTDRDLMMQISQRTISLKDLVFYCERDPHLVRSAIMLTLYDLSNF